MSYPSISRFNFSACQPIILVRSWRNVATAEIARKRTKKYAYGVRRYKNVTDAAAQTPKHHGHDKRSASVRRGPVSGFSRT